MIKEKDNRLKNYKKQTEILVKNKNKVATDKNSNQPPSLLNLKKNNYY